MGVSTDYLLGLDDDINADPVVLAAKSVADALDAHRAADLAAYTEMLRKVSACRAVFDALTSSPGKLDHLSLPRTTNSYMLVILSS
jgi:hypothetical protein